MSTQTHSKGSTTTRRRATTTPSGTQTGSRAVVTTPLDYLASAQRVAVLAARLPKRFHRRVEVGIERGQVQAIAVDDVMQGVVFADVQLICRFL